MSDASYYSFRQFAPYRGVVHAVDTDAAVACTIDGESWHIQYRMGEGRFHPTGHWIDPGARETSAAGDRIRTAIAARPPLPFARADHRELWLLYHGSHLPLALLKTRCAGQEGLAPGDLFWRPFRTGDNAGIAPGLAATDVNRHSLAALPDHRDALERLVNGAARPLASAQWFLRAPDGSGTGLGGFRLRSGDEGRVLPSAAFPELLVDEFPEDPGAAALVRAYHDWHAAMLLTHDEITPATRARLEVAAAARPEALLDVYRRIFAFVDRRHIERALIEARIAAAG